MKIYFACFCLALASFACLAQCGPMSDFFGDISNRLSQQIDDVVKNFEDSMGEVAKEFGDINRELKDVAHCYNPEVGRKIINLFDSELKTKNLVQEFYVSCFDDFVYNNKNSLKNAPFLTGPICVQERHQSQRRNAARLRPTDLQPLSATGTEQQPHQWHPDGTDVDVRPGRR